MHALNFPMTPRFESQLQHDKQSIDTFFFIVLKARHVTQSVFYFHNIIFL